jgi:glycerol-3-phosphate O-acyltransferase
LAKKRAPKAVPTSDITFEQLCMAKAMAQQLGGAEKAKEALAALSQLLG